MKVAGTLRLAGVVYASVLFTLGCGATTDGEPRTAAGGMGGIGNPTGNAASGGSGQPAAPGRGGGAQASGGTGGSGGGALGGKGSVPSDNRPPRPAWDPPFPVGEPGWEGSKEPLCQRHQGIASALEVWADDRGVFTAFGVGCNPLAQVACGKEGMAVQFNDGGGWQWIYDQRGDNKSTYRMTGFPGGPLMLFGLDSNSVSVLDEREVISAQQVEAVPPAMFVVSPELAYAVDGDRVLQYSTTALEWTELATLPAPATAIWANATTVVAVGPNQAFYVKTGAADFAALPGPLAGDYTAVWGFDSDDFWAGNQAGGLVHYDAGTWSVVQTPSDTPDVHPIQRLWGADDQLFYITDKQFGRVAETEADVLLDLAAGSKLWTYGLWGRSASEVFVTLEDHRFRDYACGDSFMLWFDGDELHQF